MSNLQSQPLYTLNNDQINARSNITPIKTVRRLKENKLNESKSKKKKEKLSSLCKTPPSVIRTRNGKDYRRGNFLGEGGFARCFQMKDAFGKIYAAKTVAKASIKNEKTKTKLLSEIKIHKSLSHPNIVNFIDCFEDDLNVYILLEICPNQSLMELLKTRKRITESEVRFFMVQIVGAIKYLHSKRVIHRDLKLGNIFFDPKMNLKIGDFGLASVLPFNESRKYTICGTPNYIAPEVLGGKSVGHSFEVDIWALGIMMYALLIGKPPFQAKDVHTIYQRIKKNEYSFPTDKPISEEAKILIKDLLSLNPLNRPTVYEILSYDWFKGSFPEKTYSISLMSKPPNVEFNSKTQLAINFANTKANAGMDDSKNKDLVIALRSEMFFEEQKEFLPRSLSPYDTRHKYQEIDLAQSGKIRKINFNIQFSNTINNLNQIIFKTYQNMKKLEHIKNETINCLELPKCENPILLSKWVDYSNKYGFSYQLTNNDIGVLFNDENTILKPHKSDKFLELIHCGNSGWTCVENLLSNPPSQTKRHLEIVDFFAKYMNSNLSNVGEIEQRKEIVFLRRYTRTSDYIMFELTNGNFQFNFKDHHKICISKMGLIVTHISPNRITYTHPLILVLKQGKFPTSDLPNPLEKITMIREAIKRKCI